MPPQPSNAGVAVFQHFTARLNLQNVQVIDYLNRGGRWLFDAVMGTLPQGCPRCGQETPLHRYGSKKQYFDDRPLDGQPVRVRLLRRRYKCLGCRKPFYEPVPDLDDRWRATRRLVREIALGSLRYPFTHLASIYGLHEKTIRRIAHTFYKSLNAVGYFPTPRWMGIDDVYLKKLPRTVLTNLRDRKLYDMLPDTRPETIRQFLEGMPGTEFIEIVCMDFSTLFRKQVRPCVPDAQIVVDKYHIIQRAIEAVDQIRRRVKKRKKGVIRDDTRILRKRRVRLTSSEKAVIERWAKDVPELATAYRLKEQFCDIWDASDDATARARYEHWKVQVATDLPKAFRRLINTISKWDQEVFHCVNWTATNGYTERMNGIIKEYNRRGRRLAFHALRAKLLYQYGYSQPAQKARKPRWEDGPNYNDYDDTESECGSPPTAPRPTAKALPYPKNTIKALAASYVMGHEFEGWLSDIQKHTLNTEEPGEECEVQSDSEEYTRLSDVSAHSKHNTMSR